MAENMDNDVVKMTTEMINMTIASPELPEWVIIFDSVQHTISIIGILANLAAFITLTKNGDCFSDVICLLQKYQSVLDGLVCVIGLFFGILPPFWAIGNLIMDTIVCQMWHSMFLYWFFNALSVWNLVLVAFERYICICHPLNYYRVTKTKIRLTIVVLFFTGLVIKGGALLQTRMHDGTCVGEYYFDSQGFKSFMVFFALSAFFTFYAIPSAIMIILYGLVINQFRQRANSNLGASTTVAVIDKATRDLTKTAIVVTIIFFVAYTYEFWYFTLGYIGVFEYTINTPLQKIGIMLSVINSVVNPFVYASFMPVYRQAVKKTFMPCIKRN